MKEPKYKEIISVENLFYAWQEFIKGKKHKKDVMDFSINLSENIFNLYSDLKTKTYTHGDYYSFNISDPKPRNIHKASVRDRLLHHAIYRVLYPYFDTKFIFDSYSCRNNKGTHKAIERLKIFARKVSKNNTKQCWILKCDIRKFFANIDQKILIDILKLHIRDQNIIWLLEKVISSFQSIENGKGVIANTYAPCNHGAKGLPLGNLTSQLLVNIYMNWFDQYVKHKIKTQYYIRYADDFVIMSTDRLELEVYLSQIQFFLKDTLQLDLHPKKVSITTLASGIDFLGWVHFANHKVLRTATKIRMLKNLQNNRQAILQSYLGLIGHGNTWKLRNKILSML